MTTRKQNKDYRNCPTAWFALLEGAIDRGKFQQAAEAVSQLKRLGIVVKWRGAARQLAEGQRAIAKQKLTILARGADR